MWEVGDDLGDGQAPAEFALQRSSGFQGDAEESYWLDIKVLFVTLTSSNCLNSC
jgi:hypothetical protein